MISSKIKELKLFKYKKTAPLFLFPEDLMHQNQIYLFPFFCYSFIETVFKMKKTHTKYTDTSAFNFTHTIIPKWSRMPL